MKHKYPSLIAGMLLLSAGIFAGPGTVHKGVITFVWNPPGADEVVDGYKLYVSTNLPPGMTYPVPKEPELQAIVLPPEATNVFAFYVSIPGSAVSYSITNVWSELGAQAFFTLTATNTTGESSFSNPAHIPAPPRGHGKDVKVELVR